VNKHKKHNMLSTFQSALVDLECLATSLTSAFEGSASHSAVLEGLGSHSAALGSQSAVLGSHSAVLGSQSAALEALGSHSEGLEALGVSSSTVGVVQGR